MTPHRPPPTVSTHRAARTLADVALRAVGLVAAVELLAAFSSETDPLAAGLTAFFALAALAFGIALLDAMLQRDRLRLVLGWAGVALLVAVAEQAVQLHAMVTGPGAYPSLGEAFADTSADLPSSLLLFALLVAVPAAAGIGLGVLIRPAAPVRGPLVGS